MVSRNQLLGHGEVEEEVEVKKVESVKLYRDDYPQGRVYEGAEMIAMMKRKKCAFYCAIMISIFMRRPRGFSALEPLPSG